MLGVNRTYDGHHETDASNPKQTSGLLGETGRRLGPCGDGDRGTGSPADNHSSARQWLGRSCGEAQALTSGGRGHEVAALAGASGSGAHVAQYGDG
jgi:hypothetical protein